MRGGANKETWMRCKFYERCQDEEEKVEIGRKSDEMNGCFSDVSRTVVTNTTIYNQQGFDQSQIDIFMQSDVKFRKFYHAENSLRKHLEALYLTTYLIHNRRPINMN